MLNELKPVPGARHSRKRIGRGTGSGHGKTAGKGNTGQNARSGGGVRPGFEGGQIPLFQRLPKRGFQNINRKEYAIVNLCDLNVFDNGTVVTPDLLIDAKIIKDIKSGVKILGCGTLEKKLTIKAQKFSASASEEIKRAGGTAEVI